MAKISIAQIASWRSGELISERKLQSVFSLIGEVINKTGDEYETLIKELNSLHLATRWIGVVDNYKDIQNFIDSQVHKPEYQPPNKPLPSSGDTIFVNNNSDDPNIPPSINPGRYMYICTTNSEGKEPIWTLYNPFTLVNASKLNDGLMSKEDFLKLQGLPTGESLDNTLAAFKKLVEDSVETSNNLVNSVVANTSDIRDIKPRIHNIENNKQNKITAINDKPLEGYTTKTVEANLIEVKKVADNFNLQDIVIWDDKVISVTSTPSGSGDNKSISFKLPVVLDPSKTFDGCFIKTYLTLNIVGQPNASIVGTLQTQVVPSNKTNTNMITTDTSTESATFENTSMDLSISYDGSSFNVVGKNLLTSDSNSYTLTLHKVIKDIGVSDYMWADLIEQDIKDFLTNSLGVKKQLITSHLKPSGFNGYEANDELTLNFTYLAGANSINIYVGGIKLTQGIEWEESKSITAYNNKITFLKNIDIAKEGYITIEGIALLLNNFVVKVWNDKDYWAAGSVVLNKGFMYYAEKLNNNVEPGSDSTIWTILSNEIDISKLEKEIKDYVNMVTNDLVDKAMEAHIKGVFSFYIKGQTTSFKDSISCTNVKKYMATKKAYRINDSGKIVYLDINEPWYEVLETTPTSFKVEWLYNIYTSVLADIKIVQGTPDEVSAQVKAELAKYHQDNTIAFDELIYETTNETTLEEFLNKNRLTTNDVEIKETTPSSLKFRLKKDLMIDGIYSDNSIFEWDSTTTYIKGSLVFKATDINDVLNTAVFYKSSKNNINQDPTIIDSEYWDIIKLKPSDISELVPMIAKEVAKQLDTLPSINYISEAQGEILDFENEIDYENYKTQYGIDDSYFQDIGQSQWATKQDIQVLYDYINSFHTDTEITVINDRNKGIVGVKIYNVYKNLQRLNCDDNFITTLIFNECILLNELTCSNNKLLDLDISNNELLEILDCGYTTLTYLNTHNNIKLKNLLCSLNELTYLGLSNNKELVELDCGHNKITELDLTNNIKLYGLNCDYNNLNELDLSNNIKLTILSCVGNNFTELDLSKNIYLTKLNCNNNYLKLVKLSKLVEGKIDIIKATQTIVEYI